MSSQAQQDIVDIYGGSDPRETPRYTYAEAARATDVPPSTVRAWVAGQTYSWDGGEGYFEPLIRRPSEDDPRLSYMNLVEVHFLRLLRTSHDVPMQRVREAIRIAKKELGFTRLLLTPQLKTSARKLFLDRFGDVLDLSPSRQLLMKQLMDIYLERVEIDRASFFPFPRSPRNRGRKVIELNPRISFGRPFLLSSGVSTTAIVKRLDAGEEVEILKHDYGVGDAEIEEALLYENAA